MNTGHAARTLEHLEELRARTRTDLGSAWFPLVVFGLLTLASTPIILLVGAQALGLYWTVAGLAGGLVVAGYYAIGQRRKGIRAPCGWPLLIAAAILAGTLGLGWYGGTAGLPLLAAVGPPLVVAGGYLAFAWLARDMLLAAVALGLAGLTGALLLGGMDPEPLTAALTIAYGGAFTLTGLGYRVAGR